MSCKTECLYPSYCGPSGMCLAMEDDLDAAEDSNCPHGFDFNEQCDECDVDSDEDW